jgi:hypothetical protein
MGSVGDLELVTGILPELGQRRIVRGVVGEFGGIIEPEFRNRSAGQRILGPLYREGIHASGFRRRCRRRGWSRWRWGCRCGSIAILGINHPHPICADAIDTLAGKLR